jgi:hypothetical protein
VTDVKIYETWWLFLQRMLGHQQHPNVSGIAALLRVGLVSELTELVIEYYIPEN